MKAHTCAHTENVVIRILTPRLPDKVRFVVPDFFWSVITHDNSLLRNFSTTYRDHKNQEKYKRSDTLIYDVPSSDLCKCTLLLLSFQES